MATILDIAQKAGVTASTVSNVLNGHYAAKRSDAARRANRIHRIAREMGYRPHVAARATRTGRTGCIGMLAGNLPAYSVHFGGFELSLMLALEARQMLLVKDVLTPDMLEPDGELPRIVAESLVDGLIINYALHIPAGITDMVARHKLPAVWINSKQPQNCVYPDDFAATRQATRYLLERGHQRIAYVDPGWRPDPADLHYSALDRRAGYEQAIRDAGLSPRAIGPDEIGPEGEPRGRILRRCERALRLCPDATAILFNGGAGETLLLAAARMGLRVPEDLSIISIENEADGASRENLSRMVVPFDAVARQAVGMLCSMLDDGETHKPPLPVTYGVIEGDTVRRLT